MSDERLRALERAVREYPEDLEARRALASEQQRLGLASGVRYEKLPFPRCDLGAALAEFTRSRPKRRRRSRGDA